MRNTNMKRSWNGMVGQALVLASTIVAVTGEESCAENWPGWRGPDRNGVSRDTGVPLNWSADSNIAWKTPLPGSGISNPIIFDDRVFVTASDGKNLANLHVICLSRDSGQIHWHQRLWGTAPTRYHGNKSSMASPSPVTDGRHVWAFFGTGDVFCFESDSGQLIWHRSLAGEYGVIENRFATSSSPLLYRDTILLQVDHYGDSYLVALDRKTGSNRWKVDRPGRWLSWSSPQLIRLKGDVQILSSGGPSGSSRSIPDGPCVVDGRRDASECFPTPLFINGRLYVVSGPSGPSCGFVPAGPGVTKTHVEWKNPRGRRLCPRQSCGKRYYLVTDSGIATCLDTETGKQVWQKRFGVALPLRRSPPVTGFTGSTNRE
ncbi:MAG: hypothetical protein Ct9H300mP1_31980 [Planctomycetaceae bacterium]|nr:MAG: hypothetical protein Ct9H300mP1_31980 [Planctomycetaceae bacterium]